MDAAESKALVQRYFDALANNDPDLGSLLAEDVSWWVPPGSDMSGEKRGREAVLAFLGGGIDYYDMTAPMNVEIRTMIAEGGRVACEFTIEATTAKSKSKATADSSLDALGGDSDANSTANRSTCVGVGAGLGG